ncbi:MAG TPA: hypothetical protein VIV27_04960 [Halioglobus sp.]
MDVILIILGVLGFGAIIISSYVFTVAARNYVSDEHRRSMRNLREAAQNLIARNPIDRRSGRPVTFPLTVNGILIAGDRRFLADRRVAK